MIFNKIHNHWQLPKELAEALKICRGNGASRHNIDEVCIETNTFVATDGRRMLAIKTKHEIPKGCYFITENNWLLGDVETKFPVWRDVIPEVKKLKSVFKSSQNPGDFSIVVAKPIEAKVAFDLTLFYPVFAAINPDHLTDFEVLVHKQDTSSLPFVVQAKSNLGEITYIQMPVNWDWETKP